MSNRWIKYTVLGLCFGVADWYFLDLLASLSRNQALSQRLDQANELIRLVIVLVLIAANYGIWLVPVVPMAIYEMKRSKSIRRAASAAAVAWSAALVSYYAYYSFMLMWVGLPNMEFMLFSNRHLPNYWADWWPPFRRVVVDQFLEWIPIAIVGGAVVGFLTAVSLRLWAKRSLRIR